MTDPAHDLSACSTVKTRFLERAGPRGVIPGRFRGILCVLVVGLAMVGFAGCDTGAPVRSRPNLSASVQGLDPASGAVTINGVDRRQPATPFRFDWGDGKTSESFFPASHVYADPRRNYIVKVSARQGDGTAETVTVPVFFRELRQDPPTAPVRSRY